MATKNETEPVGLIKLLIAFGFDPNSRSKMVRHQDTRPPIDFEALKASDEFEDYQSWQGKPKFDDTDFIVSFIGDGPGRAKLWGIYRVLGREIVPYEKLPNQVAWPWRNAAPHYHYQLERLPAYEPLEKKLVIEWSGEQAWVQYLNDNSILEWPTLHDIDLPDWSPLFGEGGAFTHLVTSRKRSREAREQCLKIHGCRCAACGMTFPEQYGGLGEGFMHAHHKTSVANRTGEYQIDPKQDMQPVCPNCHAMLHWSTDAPRSVEELRQLMGK